MTSLRNIPPNKCVLSRHEKPDARCRPVSKKYLSLGAWFKIRLRTDSHCNGGIPESVVLTDSIRFFYIDPMLKISQDNLPLPPQNKSDESSYQVHASVELVDW